MSECGDGEKLSIAIDGQTAAGKDTVARQLALRLGCVFIDTGALYRAAAWKIRDLGLLPEDTDSIGNLLRTVRFEIVLDRDLEKNRVLVDGLDVTDQLRNSEIDALSTRLARQKELRLDLIEFQKEIVAKYPKAVVTGRGIGRMVLPEADLKIYLTCDLMERVRRRYTERREQDPSVLEAAIRDEIVARDQANQSREFDPDLPTSDAVIIDTTRLVISEVTGMIATMVKRLSSPRSGEREHV